MSTVSVIIPSRNERFLVPTVNDLLSKAKGEIEIIVVLDGGEWPSSDSLPYDRVTVIRHTESLGTRASINDGVQAATGEYIMKSDAHCLFEEGFDEKLKANCQKDWVVVPRRKRLDAENWKIEETLRPDIDYEYMSWHETDFGGRGHNIVRWEDKNRDESLRSVLIDDAMCFQASCYFMHRDYFHWLELMDESTYGKTQNEGEEICFKAWLSGGRVIVNKNTWYAHLHKGSRYPRDYKFEPSDLDAVGVRKWLTDSAWHKQSKPFSWLIKKFNPPGWPVTVEFAEPLILPAKEQPPVIITRALYGTDDKRIDVTEKLRAVASAGVLDGNYNRLFGDPVKHKRKTLSVDFEYNGTAFSVRKQEREPLNFLDEHSVIIRDANGSADSLKPPIHELDQPEPAPRELSDAGVVVGDGRVLSNDLRSTLERILGKFNLDQHADYSKVSLPIGLRLNRRQIAELFAELGFKIGAEIGTAEGEYAEVLCKANPELKLYCIDPYFAYTEYRDYQNQSTLDDLLYKARQRLAAYKPGVEFRIMASTEAARTVDDGSLDFVYIDANHKYEYVVADIAAWLPKVRSGGIIAGHDYSKPNGKQFGVIEAVKGWVEAYNMRPWFVCKGEYEMVGDRSHSWMWVKE